MKSRADYLPGVLIAPGFIVALVDRRQLVKGKIPLTAITPERIKTQPR